MNDRTFEIEMERKDDYLSVRVSGRRTVSIVSSIAHQTIDECIRQKVRMVLVDVRELRGRLHLYESLSIPMKLFPVLKKRGALSKAVIVDAESNHDRFKFFEAVARKRGYNIRVFSETKPAIEWLTQSASEPVQSTDQNDPGLP